MLPSQSDFEDGAQGRRSALRAKFAIFMPLSSRELEFLSRIERSEDTIAAGQDLARTGEPYGEIYVLKRGWALRYKILENGTRVIVGFILPGDFINLGAALFQYSDCSITAVTEIVAARISAADLAEMFKTFPNLAMGVMWSVARQEACITERLVSVAGRTPVQRLVQLLLELARHRETLGEATGKRNVIPVTQLQLADSLGLSLVHVNRLFRELQERGLVRVRRGEVTLVDIDGLSRMTQFEPNYLHFERMPDRMASALFAHPIGEARTRRAEDW